MLAVAAALTVTISPATRGRRRRGAGLGGGARHLRWPRRRSRYLRRARLKGRPVHLRRRTHAFPTAEALRLRPGSHGLRLRTRLETRPFGAVEARLAARRHGLRLRTRGLEAHATIAPTRLRFGARRQDARLALGLRLDALGIARRGSIAPHRQ